MNEGKELVKRALKLGWVYMRQRGSHVVLRKGSETVIIPIHAEMKTGTKMAILKKIGKG